MDTTTIDVCLSLFPWTRLHHNKGAVKLHTMIDLRGNIPVVVHIDDGKSYDTDVLDMMIPEPGAICWIEVPTARCSCSFWPGSSPTATKHLDRT